MSLRRFSIASLTVSLVLVPAAAAVPQTASVRNGEIAFVRDAWIYVIGPGGGTPTKLIRGSNPAWSPDGTRIAFDRTDTESLYVADADGKGVKKLAGDDARLPDWSPDGTRIAFSDTDFPFPDECTPTAYFEALWTIASDGSDKKLLSPANVSRENCGVPGGEFGPAWSPSGKRMIFTSKVLCDPHQTYCEGMVIAPVAGLTLRGQSSWRGLRGSEAAWSPDGKQIVWDKQWKRSSQLFVSAPTATSKARRLTRAKQDSYEPAWSPDGTKIVFVRGCELRILDVRTRKVRKLTGGSSCDESPAWQPLR